MRRYGYWFSGHLLEGRYNRQIVRYPALEKDLISDLRGEIAALKAEVNDLTDERAEMESTPIHAELVMTQMALEVSEHKNECLKAEIENLRKINKKSAIGKDKALQ